MKVLPREAWLPPLHFGENQDDKGRPFWVCRVQDIPDTYWNDVGDGSFWQLDRSGGPLHQEWHDMAYVNPYSHHYRKPANMGSGRRYRESSGEYTYSYKFAAIPIKYRTDRVKSAEPVPVEWGEEAY